MQKESLKKFRLGLSFRNCLSCINNCEDQYTRKNSVEVHGISENLYPSTQDAVIKVAEVLNITIVPSDVEICHKLKRNKGPQPILVKLLSHQTKSKFYRERIKLKNVKISDIYPSYSSSLESRIGNSSRSQQTQT